MAKILVAIDGSIYSARAVEHLLKTRPPGATDEIHLLNVQIPVESGHARMFVDHDTVTDYYLEEGLAALRPAREILDRAQVPYTHHVAVGHVADSIAAYASEHGFDQIVIGSHGRGALTHLLLGSVASDVVRQSDIPVMLVK